MYVSTGHVANENKQNHHITRCNLYNWPMQEKKLPYNQIFQMTFLQLETVLVSNYTDCKVCGGRRLYTLRNTCDILTLET